MKARLQWTYCYNSSRYFYLAELAAYTFSLPPSVFFFLLLSLHPHRLTCVDCPWPALLASMAGKIFNHSLDYPYRSSNKYGGGYTKFLRPLGSSPIMPPLIGLGDHLSQIVLGTAPKLNSSLRRIVPLLLARSRRSEWSFGLGTLS